MIQVQTIYTNNNIKMMTPTIKIIWKTIIIILDIKIRHNTAIIIIKNTLITIAMELFIEHI
jgi:hypothetical protein